MFAAFELRLTDKLLTLLKTSSRDKNASDSIIVQSSIRENRQNFREALKNFILSDDSLDASRLEEAWFPSVEAEVFISHSHKDEKLAIELAACLKRYLGLTSFIDSTVWGYANNLQRLIDDEYCYSSENGFYSYRKRNYATTHVHLILNTALMKMIDKTEIVIFLNTPQSTKSSQTLLSEGDNTTNSPWIYSELSIVQSIRRKKPKRPIKKTAKAGEKELKVTYPLPKDRLIELTSEKMKQWIGAGIRYVSTHKHEPKPSTSLAVLYRILLKKQ